MPRKNENRIFLFKWVFVLFTSENMEKRLIIKRGEVRSAMKKQWSRGILCSTLYSSSVISFMLIRSEHHSGKGKAKWQKPKREKNEMICIWTWSTWFFIGFLFFIYILLHGLEYLCNESEYRKAAFPSLPFTSSYRRRRRRLYFVIVQILQIFLCFADIRTKYRLRSARTQIPVRNLRRWATESTFLSAKASKSRLGKSWIALSPLREVGNLNVTTKTICRFPRASFASRTIWR